MKVICLFISFIFYSSCMVYDKPNSDNKLEVMKSNEEIPFSSEVSVEYPILEYYSHSRGFYYVLKVYTTYATIVKNPNDKPLKIEVPENDIIELQSMVNAISTKDFLAFKAPTEKRFFDGAPHTVLSIYKNGKIYKSQTFDGGFPPKGIEVLVNKVLSLHTEK